MQHVLYWISALFVLCAVLLFGALKFTNRTQKREEDDIDDMIDNY